VRDAQVRASVVVALRLQVEVVPTSNPLKIANVVVIKRINVWLVRLQQLLSAGSRLSARLADRGVEELLRLWMATPVAVALP
jgi:hypothetical protein